MEMNRRRFAGLMALAPLAYRPGAAAAQVPVTFAGKTVEWTIPYGEGGGNDAWARFFAPYLSKYLPGNPTVVVRNVPGGGGLSGANSFARRASSNGLALLGLSGSNQFPYLLGDPRVQYDYRNFIPVLVSPTGGVVYLPTSLGIKDASDLKSLGDRELVYANTGATALDLVLMLAFELLGLNVRHVFGMSSRGETRIAFERGEATIDYQTSSSYLANIVPLVEMKKVVPLFSLGALDANGNLVRDPTFPDIPNFLEAYVMMHGQAPKKDSMLDAYLAFFSAGFPAQKMAVLPKNTPPEFVEAYRTAFAAAVTDPELQERKEDILGDYQQATGAAADKLFEVATHISPATRAWMREYLQTKYNVKL
ncbi:Bug family tripartite tricarboxylate transporter substrate binding protein [Ancylobacter sp. VNQ12]|uniref:Bug family tripartite tricarboxylate transporter substrate binding protein n=1 Tax=Ancylobacter sp. VNQ12 TaxID=3400920 RepID=UPI003C12ACDB